MDNQTKNICRDCKKELSKEEYEDSLDIGPYLYCNDCWRKREEQEKKIEEEEKQAGFGEDFDDDE